MALHRAGKRVLSYAAASEAAVACGSAHSQPVPRAPIHHLASAAAVPQPARDIAALRFQRSFQASTVPFTSVPAASEAAVTVEDPLILATLRCGVAVVTLNRPDKMNALSFQLMEELLAKLMELDECPDTRAIVVAARGKAFCAGADVEELARIQSYAEAYQMQLFENWNDILRIRTPLIAAVNGPAAGGGMELAMACDLVIAAEEATFSLPELRLGLIPGGGGTQRFSRRVGKARAMEMILTSQSYSAWEAERVGIVSRVVKRDQLQDTAVSLAQRIAANSAVVVTKAKECIAASFEMPLEEGLKFEKREFWSCFGLHDTKEGIAAFLEKRRPRFTDT